MKNTKFRAIATTMVVLFITNFALAAQPRFDQVWTCTLNEGQTVEDLNAVHGKWLKWANKQKYGGDIRGYIAQAVVASSFVVIIVDSYPDMATLAADWKAYNGTKEGQAIEAEYEEAATCTSNALYAVMDSGAM